MLHHINLIRHNPMLRMVFFVTLLFGTFVASIGPYQSLVAIQVFGLSDTVYALVLILALLVSIGASVGIGIVTDQRPSRRRMAQLAAGTLVIGGALVWLVPTPLTFVMVHIILIPVSGTLFGQLFAVSRLVSAPMAQPDKDGILSIMRAMMAARASCP